MPSLSTLTSFAKGLVTHAKDTGPALYLVDIDPKTNTRTVQNSRGEPLSRTLALQYFPSSLRDTKEKPLQRKDIPGASLPLYQWTFSGERQISFTAIFTCDMDLLSDGSQFARQNYNRLDSVGEGNRNVDIRAAQIWLRRFMLPKYGSGTQTSEAGVPLTTAPRRLRLEIPNSAIGLIGGEDPGGTTNDDSVTCLMTQCDFEITAWHESGLPRYATAQLAFVQTAQFSSQVIFPHASDRMEDAIDGNIGSIIGYKVKKG